MNKNNTKNKKPYIPGLFIIFLVAISSLFIHSDDKELFMGVNIGTNVVRPNVMILMDSSGSMNTIIFYPKKGVDNIDGTADDGYVHNTPYTGTVESITSELQLDASGWYLRWRRSGNADVLDNSDLENIDGKNHWTGCYAGDGTPNNFQVGSHGANYFQVGDRIAFRDTASPYNHALATIKRKYDVSGNPWFELEDIVGGPITVNGGTFQRKPESKNWYPSLVRLYGTTDHSYKVRYPVNYIKWVFIHASDAQRTAITHFCTYATFDITQTPIPVLSNCATPGNDDLSGSNPRIKQTFTRIQTAREVICNVAAQSNQTVRLGLFIFNGDNGGSLVEHLGDQSDENSFVAYRNSVYDIAAESWTPLAETLADIWKYYKPGPSSKTYWPVDWEIANNLVNHSTSNPVSPIQYWCQNNYVVIMTDGESTKDKLDSTKYSGSIFRSKPVKRTEPWLNTATPHLSWNNGWGDTDNYEQNSGTPSSYNINGTYCPNYSCWSIGDGGSDYLDDIAYFLRHQDMFPDSYFGTSTTDGWPGNQNVYTYAIGFNADNHLLQHTAINGDGAYYTATNYDELVEAFQLVITSINLRNYAFASITAPKKSTTATNETLSASYVGYFMPSQATPIWDGHLVAFKLHDEWRFDFDDNGTIGDEDPGYESQDDCLADSGGKNCERFLYLDVGHMWDVADKIPANRTIYTHNNSTTLIDFTAMNVDTLRPLLGAADNTEAEQVINKIRAPHFSDVFHSDVGYVGPPIKDKSYFPNINPTGPSDELYLTFYNNHKTRRRVIYVGTNDGIFHMIYADANGQNDAESGREVWGFIPDEVLPTLKTSIISGEHAYSVDGRITTEDIYYEQGGINKWMTLLVFGLRSGGNHYYAMDVTTVSNQPVFKWKFTEPTYSGQSWGKPIIAKVRIQNPSNPSELIDKWVVFLTGGMAYNSENPNSQAGKAIFMLDAANGNLLWMIGYNNANGEADDSGTIEIDTTTSDDVRYLTKADVFNFPIPSAMTVIDSKNTGFADTIYFGNIGGHMFKLDISNMNPANWKTTLIYKATITPLASETVKTPILAISGDDITVTKNVFSDSHVGNLVLGVTSKAQGYIISREAVGNTNILTIHTFSGTFIVGEVLALRRYDPVYLAPAIAYGQCYNLWVMWGTGDRDRPRTNPNKGRFIALLDNNTYENTLTDLADFSTPFYNGTEAVLNMTNFNGWYFNFEDNGEKIFDPEPVIVPDESRVPHVYFNTYQPPQQLTVHNIDNPCDAPDEGSMTLYDIAFSCSINEDGTLANTMSGTNTTGRIAGGGVYSGVGGGKDFILFESESGDVASAPQSQQGGEEQTENEFKAVSNKLYYHGGVVFWKVKKR